MTGESGDNNPPVADPEAQAKAREHNERAKKLFEAEKYAEAEAEVRQALRYAPKWASLYDNLGTICAEQNKYVEALTSYVQALKLDPQSPTVMFNLGHFLLHCGLDTAHLLLEKTLEKEPQYPDARRTLGDLFVERGENSRAISAFARAIEQNPKDSRARFRLSDIFWEQGDFHEAAQQLKAILKVQPDDATAWYRLGLAHYELDMEADAEHELLKALELDPDYLECHYHLACVYAKNFQVQPALEHLGHALAINREKVSDWAQADENLDNLRRYPEFDRLFIENHG
jgi:Flp pilus assembly protein TadD